MRLRDIQQAYGNRVRVHWRTFPLIPGEQPGRRVTEKTRESRLRVGAEEPRACFVPPDIDAPLPSSSIPALIAAKCAERQGESAFQRFHERQSNSKSAALVFLADQLNAATISLDGPLYD